MSSGRKNRSKYLSPEQLDEAVGEVARAAHDQNIDAALVGGVRLQYLGSDRLTGDVDFIASELIEELPRGEELSFGGESTEVDGVPVDIIVRSDEFAPLYEEALEKAESDDDIDDLFVVRPDYLMAMKMVAGRGKDQTDLEFLIESSNPEELIDARDIIRRFLGPYAAREFDSLIDEIEWKKSKKSK